MYAVNFFFTLLPVLLLSCATAKTSETIHNAAPTTIKSYRQYKLSLKDSAHKEMVSLKKNIPGIIIQLKYSTVDNFTHQQLYPASEDTYLRRMAVEGLKKIQETLRPMGLGLKVWDAYRPYDATVKMWHLIGDERYVANPSNGSNHNRGTAVDLTLINLSDSTEVNMGTGFDNFSDTASSHFKHLPDGVLKKRELLKETMTKYGFRSLDSEWWHFSLPDSKRYEILNIDFGNLGKKIAR